MSPIALNDRGEPCNTSPRHPFRWRVRFNLATLFLLVIPLGVGFVWLRSYLDNRPIAWRPYSTESLTANVRAGRTVLVSFRAQWDLTGIVHEKMALETPAVRRAIRAQNVVALRADWTNRSPEIESALQSLGERSIPVIVIYSASFPNDPIVLDHLITEKQVLAGLEASNHSR